MKLFKFIKWQWNEFDEHNKALIGGTIAFLTSTLVFIFHPSVAILIGILGASILSFLVFLLYKLYKIIKHSWNTYQNYIDFEEEKIIKVLKNETIRPNPYTRHNPSR